MCTKRARPHCSCARARAMRPGALFYYIIAIALLYYQGYQPNRICAAVKPGYAQKSHRENASARVNRNMRSILLEKTRICATKPGYAQNYPELISTCRNRDMRTKKTLKTLKKKILLV